MMVMCSLVSRVVVYNLVHVPDSDMCKAINARMYDSSSSSNDDDLPTPIRGNLSFFS